MSLQSTAPSELGLGAAAAIRHMAARSIGTSNVASYIERDSPLPWNAIAEGGWDLIGAADDDEPAALRDLVEVAIAWGETPAAVPFIPSLIAKRHSLVAAAVDGPVTYSIATRTSREGSGLVPFGAVTGIAVMLHTDAVSTAPGERAEVDFDPVLRAARAPMVTTMTEGMARDIGVLAAAEAAGAARRIVGDAIEFTRGRLQFGKPIGSFQAIKHHMANAHLAAQLAETGAIWGSLDPLDWRRAVKQSLTQSRRAVELAMQVHGGLGFTWEMGVHIFLRHVIALASIAEGSSRHHDDATRRG
jgi:hypothetical protein